MQAHAVVVAEAARDGDCSFSTLRSDPPLLLRPTPFGLHLQGGAAGPLGGDRLRLDVRVQAGASLSIRTVAASIVLPGRAPSELDIEVRVDEGAHLDWHPEPLVSVVGSRHRQRVSIELASTSTLRWHETLVLGRTGEPPGTIDTRTRIDRAGEVLLHHDLRLGDPADSDSWRSAAGIADAKLVATTVHVGGSEPMPCGAGPARTAVFQLAHDAWVVQAVDNGVDSAPGD